MTELNGGASTIWGADYLANPAACGKVGFVPVAEMNLIHEETGEWIPNGRCRTTGLQFLTQPCMHTCACTRMHTLTYNVTHSHYVRIHIYNIHPIPPHPIPAVPVLVS
jgi:hypothetical protein